MIEGQEVKWLSKVQERRQKSYLPVTTSAYILFGANTILFGAETKQIRGESKNTFITSTGVMGILSLLNKGRRQKKKRGKNGQADRLGGVTPLQPDRFYFVKILTHFTLYKMAK